MIKKAKRKYIIILPTWAVSYTFVLDTSMAIGHIVDIKKKTKQKKLRIELFGVYLLFDRIHIPGLSFKCFTLSSDASDHIHNLATSQIMVFNFKNKTSMPTTEMLLMREK